MVTVTDALHLVADATAARAQRRKAYEAADAGWRQAIRDALAAGHSQIAVADAAGITQGRVAQILAGRR